MPDRRQMDAAEAERWAGQPGMPLAELEAEALKAAEKIASLSLPVTRFGEAVNAAFETTWPRASASNAGRSIHLAIEDRKGHDHAF